MLVLLFVALWFTRRFVVCLSVCHFVLVFFSPFSIAIGRERVKLSAFRTFVRFVLGGGRVVRRCCVSYITGASN